jgi:hypothetical protein
VLEDGYLHYYESFDPKADGGIGVPKKKKGTVPVHNAKITTFPHKGDSKQKFCFVMEHESRRPFYASAPTEKLMYLWLDALKKASKLEFDEKEVNTDEYYELLGFKPEEVKANGTPEVKDIQKLYRKACLRVHPDKPTGSLELFEKVQEAYEMLMSIKEQEEEDRIYDVLEFSTTVKKGPRGVGLGLVVQEDPKKGVINVTKVSESILCTMHAEFKERFKHVAPGDTLTQVGEDRIKGWPLNRVVERLNDFRVPIGRSILMKFSRRVRKGVTANSITRLTSSWANLSPAPSGRDDDDSGGSDGDNGDDHGGSHSGYPYPSTPVDQGAGMGVRDSECADPSLVNAEIVENGDDDFMNGETVKDKLRMSEVVRGGLEEENAKLYEEISRLRDRCVQAEAQESSLKRQLEESELARRDAEASIVELQKEVSALLVDHEDVVAGGPAPRASSSWIAAAQQTQTQTQTQKQRISSLAAQAQVEGSVMSKWQAKGAGHSAEAKLNRLEQRLASLGRNGPGAPVAFGGGRGAGYEARPDSNGIGNGPGIGPGFGGISSENNFFGGGGGGGGASGYLARSDYGVGNGGGGFGGSGGGGGRIRRGGSPSGGGYLARPDYLHSASASASASASNSPLPVVSSPTASAQELRDSLKQRLEFRPQKKHLVQNGILTK